MKSVLEYRLGVPMASPFTSSYDYLGRRVRKTVYEWDGSSYELSSDEKYLYDGWNVATVYDVESTHELKRTHTWGLDLSRTLAGAGGVGGLLGVEEMSGSNAGVYHYTYDANGNVSEVLDDAGDIAAHYEYDPFGNVIRSHGTYADNNVYRFSTKHYDVETGFYYYGLRHYDAETGRWLSRDPIGELGGLNLYGFVGNNGVMRVDLLGLWHDSLHGDIIVYVSTRNAEPSPPLSASEIKDQIDALNHERVLTRGALDALDRIAGGRSPFFVGPETTQAEIDEARARGDEVVGVRGTATVGGGY